MKTRTTLACAASELMLSTAGLPLFVYLPKLFLVLLFYRTR